MGKVRDLPIWQITPASGAVAVDVNIVGNQLLASEPTVYKITMPGLANTDEVFVIPTGTKRFSLIPGNGALSLKYSTSPEVVIPPRGSIYNETNLNTVAGLTLTIQSSTPSDILTLLTWN